ncbi:F-box/WD repeat-containing protein 7 isoform X2 [Eurytemora carolleeae]|uniref:F-box/WD repeat-containing protein 7 isoform X2 n=1 Tax=Eurytemora carolleeae TaxID=1294199 RepID=UPI000C769192|nr:F-box/WD repeat-containing protein 7 isoform X2 [Eurytemora carolleeae]|eukprot:XP_023346135.1 F-box/WD repeat-containing protein 7-like isoform X2 [Eurytemora affinis]
MSLKNNKLDILGELQKRNLINILGNILDQLSPHCLRLLQFTCSLYREIVKDDPRSVRRLELSRRWLYGQPTVLPICQRPGYMVTALAAHPGDSIIFGLLGDNATVNMYKKDTLKLTARLEQSREFPASIPALVYNDQVVVTCVYESLVQGGLNHVLYIWRREDNSLASTFSPHSQLIRTVKLANNFILTASNDGTIVVTDLTNPSQPTLKHTLTGHKDYVSGLDNDASRVVSVSVDNIMKVWSIPSFKCVFSVNTETPTLKVSMSWPLAVTGGKTTLVLWNLELQFKIRELNMESLGSLSVVCMTYSADAGTSIGSRYKKTSSSSSCQQQHAGQQTKRRNPGNVYIVSGDNHGKISIWDTSRIIAGHSGVDPHRQFQIGPTASMISSLAVDEYSIITGDWAGQVLVWKFV